MTWSPTATSVTPSPTASTTPAPSWPSTTGSGFGVAPVITFQSLWQTPLADDADGHLAGAGVGELDLLDGQRLVDLAEDGGAHARDSTGASARYARRRCGCRQPCCGSRAVRSRSSTSSWRRRRQGEVLVRIAACGVCAQRPARGRRRPPGAAAARDRPRGVRRGGRGRARASSACSPGDHVVLALVPSCGRCEACRAGRPNFCEQGGRMAATGTLADGTSRLSRGRAELKHFNSVSSFAEYAVVPESVAVPIRRRRPARSRGPDRLRGAHGLGSGDEDGRRRGRVERRRLGLRRRRALRRSRPPASPGRSRSSPSTRARRSSSSRERLGATATVEARPTADTADASATRRRAAPDYAFEAIGREETIREAWEAVRPGGTAVVARAPAEGDDGHDRHLGLHQREDAQGLLPRLRPHPGGRPAARRPLRGGQAASGRARQRPDRARRATGGLRAPTRGRRRPSARRLRARRPTRGGGGGSAWQCRRSSSTGMWQRMKWPALDLGERRLLLLADRAELARAARVEDAAGRRVGGARDLALQPDPRPLLALERRARRRAAPPCTDGAGR